MGKVPDPETKGSKIPLLTPVPEYTPVPTPLTVAGDPPVNANEAALLQTLDSGFNVTVGIALMAME